MNKTTQKISRADLKTIYDSISENCNWRKKIQDMILWSDDKNIEIEESVILQGYNEANSEQKKLLEKYFKIAAPKSIIDRVKNLNDIFDISGENISSICPWKNPKTKRQRQQNHAAILQHIGDVLNDGWEAKFGVGQYNYYPWFQKDSTLGGGWSYYSVVYGDYDCSRGVVVYYKSSELARFAGKTFIKEYSDFLNKY